MNNPEIICLESPAFEALIRRVARLLKETQPTSSVNVIEWITPEEAKKKLNISSDTTLMNLRNQGKIRYTQPLKKLILYDRQSIDEYLEKNSRETF